MTRRSTIFALVALLVASCGSSARETRRAQTSGYDADFAIVYTATLAAVTKLYPHLVENPAAGVVKTAWHQVRIRQTGERTGNRRAVGNPGDIDTRDPGGSLTRTAQDTPGHTQHFIRFNVYVLGGRPWRVRIDGEAAEWEPGMKQTKLTGAARPPWLQGRVEALQVAVYRSLSKHAVPIELTKARYARPAPAAPTIDLSVYGDIPEAAAIRVHALRSTLLGGDFQEVRSFLVDDFVWSAGAAPNADQAIMMWQADPTLASQLVATLDAGCESGEGAALTCPPGAAAGTLRATFVMAGDTWYLSSFLVVE